MNLLLALARIPAWESRAWSNLLRANPLIHHDMAKVPLKKIEYGDYYWGYIRIMEKNMETTRVLGTP